MSTIIKAGTTNSVKIAAINAAFEHFFEDVQVRGYEVDSHVSRQPIDKEVYKGAENRLAELKKDSDEYDYLVACEAGMICQYGHWFNVQVVLIEDKTGKRGFGLSQGFEIPYQYVQEAMFSSVAQVLDRLFGGAGGIRVLTKGQFTREQLVRDATTMALARVLNGKMW